MGSWQVKQKFGQPDITKAHWKRLLSSWGGWQLNPERLKSHSPNSSCWFSKFTTVFVENWLSRIIKSSPSSEVQLDSMGSMRNCSRIIFSSCSEQRKTQKNTVSAGLYICSFTAFTKEIGGEVERVSCVNKKGSTDRGMIKDHTGLKDTHELHEVFALFPSANIKVFVTLLNY